MRQLWLPNLILRGEFYVVTSLKYSLIRKPTFDEKPKSTEIPPFRAGSGFNALAKGSQNDSFSEKTAFSRNWTT